MLPWLVGLLLKEPRGSSLTCPSSSDSHGAPQRPPLQPECGQKSRRGVGRGDWIRTLPKIGKGREGQVEGWGSGTHVFMQLLVQGRFVMLTPLHFQPLDQWLDGQALQTGRR